jgi:aminopeptidase N
MRLKKGMKVKSLRRSDGTALEWIQEDWEGGFTVLLPSPLKTGEKVTLEAEMEGDFIYDRGDTFDCHFPFVNSEWYPRHGYLGRSFFDLEYLHPKRYKVASAGTRVKEEPWAENKDYVLTTYKLEKPVALVTFAMGPYEIHKENLKLSAGGELPVEFYSMPGGALAIKEDFIVAEMKNGINYFSALFGAYPYPVFRAAFHPFGFGQGFATMLVIPPTDRASKYVYSFISHETGHQWWGNIVGWRSYRDQWLSEGFAEYSGVLYTQRRQNPGAARELLVEMRDSLKEPPETETGIGAGKLTDIGPLILGLRLSTRESRNAYGTLVYNKGGLVLRMLHFLFTDPVTGNGEPFFEMMRDFVNRNRNGWATTEGFMEVANEHFARTPIAQKYGITNLNWFFRQWVWQTHLPSYRLEYTFEIMPDGKVQLRGTLFQENTPQNWVMPLPLVFKFGGNQVARGTVLANGPQSPVAIALPQRPDSVELDPEMWVLSEKTQTKKR